MSTGHTHDGDDHDHGHEHPAAPMVEEITDYEILEIAVRELAIEHGLFTAEDHRRFTEWAESVGPINGSRLVAKAWTDPAFKALVLEDGHQGLQGGARSRLGGTDRFWHPERLHEFRCARKYANTASRDRLHALLVLPTPDTRHVARMVPHNQLPAQVGPLAPRGARRIRIDPSARGGGKSRGLKSEVPLHGSSGPA